MAKLEELRTFGANVEEGLARCVNNEDFYLRMVSKAVDDSSVDDLDKAINDKDLDQAFEIAHALKGVYANLALTPMLEPVSEMTELLRSRTDTDYSAYLSKIRAKRDELIKIIR